VSICGFDQEFAPSSVHSGETSAQRQARNFFIRSCGSNPRHRASGNNRAKFLEPLGALTHGIQGLTATSEIAGTALRAAAGVQRNCWPGGAKVIRASQCREGATSRRQCRRDGVISAAIQENDDLAAGIQVPRMPIAGSTVPGRRVLCEAQQIDMAAASETPRPLRPTGVWSRRAVAGFPGFQRRRSGSRDTMGTPAPRALTTARSRADNESLRVLVRGVVPSSTTIARARQRTGTTRNASDMICAWPWCADAPGNRADRAAEARIPRHQPPN